MTNPNDHPPLYKLRVYTHAGVFKHELVLDSLSGLSPGQVALNLTDGPSLKVKPGGDCQQADFSGVGDDLGITYQDLVEILWSDDQGATWTSRWAGYADTVAPQRDPEPYGYVCYGLRQRLDRVEARQTVAQDYPNRQFAQLINDLIDSGQVGQAINRMVVPEVGVGEVRPAILPRYESVLTVADKWLSDDSASTMEASSDENSTATADATGLSGYGIDATRTPIWGKAGGVHVLDEADGVLIESKPGSSARLRTHIRVTFVAVGKGPYIAFSKSLLGDQEGVQATTLIQVADPDVYGQSSTREVLQPLARYFTRAPCIAVKAIWSPGSGYVETGQAAGASGITGGIVVYQNCEVQGDVATLNDGDIATSVYVVPPVNKDPAAKGALLAGGTFLVEVTYPPGPVPFGVVVHAVGGTVSGFLFDGVLDVRCAPDDNGFLIFPDEIRDWIGARWNGAGTSRCQIRVSRSGTAGINVTTFGAVYLDGAQVRLAVQQYAHLPTANPETFRVPGWNVDPLAYVVGVYRDPDGTESGRSDPKQVDVYNYVVDAEGQQWTEVQVAQGDEADDVAMRAMIERLARTEAVKAALSR